MAVKIRLARHGGRSAPSTASWVANVESPRTGGSSNRSALYDPGRSPSLIQFQTDKLAAWLKKGARPTQTVAQLIRKARSSRHHLLMMGRFEERSLP